MKKTASKKTPAPRIGLLVQTPAYASGLPYGVVIQRVVIIDDDGERYLVEYNMGEPTRLWVPKRHVAPTAERAALDVLPWLQALGKQL